MKCLVLMPQRSTVVLDRVRWECQVVRKDGDRVESLQDLWFDAPTTDEASLGEGDAEPYLIACLLWAMQEARALVVHGRVSRCLLQNLDEYMVFWSRVAPSRYQQVEISVDVVEDQPVPPPGADVLGTGPAMAAFSGGLDATFLAWRHHTQRAGWRSRNIRFFVMLSGFDIRHGQVAHVDASMASARQTLADIGAELKTLRTNLRDLVPVRWDDLHGTCLVACMHFFKAHVRTLLAASCEPYDDLVIPWGMSPLSDHLLSSASLRVIHDGAEFSRSEKAAGVSDWAVGRDHLRVCWQDQALGGNCMKCEKCLRTTANFAMKGVRIPASLGGDDRHLRQNIFRIKLRTPAQESEWRSIRSMPFPGDRRPLWHRWIPVLLAVSRLRRWYYVVKGQPERAGVRKMSSSC